MILSKRKNGRSEFFSRAFCFLFVGILTILTALMPVSTYALSSALFPEYSQADIYFYDPSAGAYLNFCNSGGDCYITGNTDEEKLWSALRHVGFTPEQTAALMGNIKNEAGTLTRQEDAYNYARDRGCTTLEGEEITIYTSSDANHMSTHSGCVEGYSYGEEFKGVGLGMVQWTWPDRRMGFLNKMKEAGLLKYFEGDAYKKYGGPGSNGDLQKKIIEETGSDADYWALWCATVKYIWAEMNAKYTGFFSQGSLDDYSHYVSEIYEGCAGCDVGGSQYIDRARNAQEIYAKYMNGEFDAVEKGTAIPNTTEVDKNETKPNTEGNEGDESLEEDNKEETNKEEQTENDDSSKITISTDNCSSMPTGGAKTPEDALLIAQQYIIDTNQRYGTSYLIPDSAELNKFLNTPNNDDPVGDGGGCWGGCYCGQCTALSGWFVTKMTGYIYGGGDGGEVVGNLIAENPDLSLSDISYEPSVFSVFSERGGQWGHTGIVIGQTDSGDYITIENNLKDENGHGTRLMIKTHSSFDDSYVFVNVNKKLKLEHLGER